MRSLTTVIRACASAALALLLSACGSEMAGPRRAIEVSVSPSNVTFTSPGDTARFTAVVIPVVLLDVRADVSPVNPAVVWTSSNPQIASVDSAGLVTAHAAGVVTIAATAVADTSAHGYGLVTCSLHSPSPGQ